MIETKSDKIYSFFALLLLMEFKLSLRFIFFKAITPLLQRLIFFSSSFASASSTILSSLLFFKIILPYFSGLFDSKVKIFKSFSFIELINLSNVFCDKRGVSPKTISIPVESDKSN